MIKPNSYHPSLALGGVFLSLFGAAWLFGAGVEYAGPNVPMLAAIAIATLTLTIWAISTFRTRRAAFTGNSDAAVGKRIRKGFMLVNAVQWSSIGLAVLLLNLTGHVAWILPAVIMVVGLHFFPLARLFGYSGYNRTALALVVVGVLALLSGSAGDTVAITLLATGIILWLTALSLLRAV